MLKYKIDCKIVNRYLKIIRRDKAPFLTSNLNMLIDIRHQNQRERK